ncbi:MAG: 4Fe-4S binding protein [bacterium]|nr:4Fe-4S binding protein [bacterium]
MKARFHPLRVGRRTTAALFSALLFVGGSSWFPWFEGSIAGARWFGVVSLTDPLAALEATVASRTVQTEMLLGAGLPAALAVLLGPVFCGWICPLGLLFDLNQSLRDRVLRLAKRPTRPRPRRSVPRELRWVLLGLFVGASLTMQFPVFQTLSPINIVGWSLVFGALPALALVAALVVAEWFAARLWCRALCPLGALYGLLGRFAPLRVRIHPIEAHRRPCFLCSASCPVGIRVVEEFTLSGKSSVDDPDCTRCGECIEVCPRQTLKIGFRDFRE